LEGSCDDGDNDDDDDDEEEEEEDADVHYIGDLYGDDGEDYH